MALREVKPLDDRQWEQVTSQLKSGPTKESIATVKDAIKRASKLNKA